MGDRIGLIFRDSMGDDNGIIIHSHWMGRELLKLAQRFYKECSDETKEACCDTVTARFMLWLGITQCKHVDDLDIDIQPHDDDCEDNGVWVMDMGTGLIGE